MISKSEKILEAFIHRVVAAIKGKTVLYEHELTTLQHNTKTALDTYSRTQTLNTFPFQFNPPDQEEGELKGIPLCASDFLKSEKAKGNPSIAERIKPVSYMDVHELLGTSGCSRGEPFWTWMVMGVINTQRGKLAVYPGDWVVEIFPEYLIVLSDEQYRNLYG